MSPAIAAGVVDRLMEVSDLVALLETEERGLERANVRINSQWYYRAMNYVAVLLIATTAIVSAQSTKSRKPVPVAIYKIAPAYTQEARQAIIEGDVVLRAIINEKGKAKTIRVIKPLGYGLDEKAMACLRKWRFQPAITRDGRSYSVQRDVSIEFRLGNSK